VPSRAILISSAFGYLTVLTSVIAPEILFAFLVNASGAIMLMVYAMVCLAQIRLRRRMEREHPERLSIKVWAFPWLSMAAIGAIVAAMLAMLFTRSLATQLYASLAAAAVVVVAWWLRSKAMLSAPASAATET
jgi:AAT family amino acid transporter/GABA permease